MSKDQVNFAGKPRLRLMSVTRGASGVIVCESCNQSWPAFGSGYSQGDFCPSEFCTSHDVGGYPKRGTVGFYTPDPGQRGASVVLDVTEDGRILVFENSSNLVIQYDLSDWCSAEEMAQSTLAIATSERYATGDMADMREPLLQGRLRALAQAIGIDTNSVLKRYPRGAKPPRISELDTAIIEHEAVSEI